MIKYFLLGFVIAFIIGYFIGLNKDFFNLKPKHYDGTFHVDTTNPNKDVFTLELSCAIGEIPEKTELIFNVQNEGSQEKPSL